MEFHPNKVFRKLGISSRRPIASRIGAERAEEPGGDLAATLAAWENTGINASTGHWTAVGLPISRPHQGGNQTNRYLKINCELLERATGIEPA